MPKIPITLRQALDRNIALTTLDPEAGVADIAVPKDTRGRLALAHRIAWAPTMRYASVGLGCTAESPMPATATPPDSSVPAMIRFRV
jgi:hypothetical protein